MVSLNACKSLNDNSIRKKKQTVSLLSSQHFHSRNSTGQHTLLETSKITKCWHQALALKVIELSFFFYQFLISKDFLFHPLFLNFFLLRLQVNS